MKNLLLIGTAVMTLSLVGCNTCCETEQAPCGGSTYGPEGFGGGYGAVGYGPGGYVVEGPRGPHYHKQHGHKHEHGHKHGPHKHGPHKHHGVHHGAAAAHHPAAAPKSGAAPQ